MSKKEEITRLLEKVNAGKEGAEEALIPFLYNELRNLAHYYMSDERRDHTLQTTALVNEAYIRLCGGEKMDFAGKAHYMRLAARTMRRVLIDHARSKQSLKKGGGWVRMPLEDLDDFQIDDSVDMIALDEALEKLSEVDPKLAQLVELKFFGGLTVEETARVLDISPRTVKSDWQMAKVWLKQELS